MKRRSCATTTASFPVRASTEKPARLVYRHARLHHPTLFSAPQGGREGSRRASAGLALLFASASFAGQQREAFEVGLAEGAHPFGD